jgi:hypothetical protein
MEMRPLWRLVEEILEYEAMRKNVTCGNGVVINVTTPYLNG